MKEIILFSALTVLAFLVFATTFALGLLKKKKSLIILSVFALIAFLGLGVWTGYTIVIKTSSHVTNAFKPRTGDAIYNALFDQRKVNCVQVIQHQDQVVPKIDYAIWLHFQTCPEELKRILSRHEFSMGKLPTHGWDGIVPYGEALDWFNPASMGDTILVYEYSTNDSRNIQTIWVSLDSTEAYCRDILD